MPATRKCPKCGAEVAGEGLGGLCPKCVAQLALASVEDLKPTIAVPVPLTEKPGDRIGHYKLLQQIGEGGCGVVYMAEQEEPVRRRVALKVIKLGMDTKQVIARFEAERQALALMDHPNIAKVFDADATETGRPYFVMELVRGVKITDYCDQNNLSTTQRLDLFMQVCRAIQHAHQKGIIHRDIKPSNILVTMHDGVPVPKVIDFGIAKATTDQRLTDKTLFTAFEQFIGTPAYMSPEQAEMSALDIDTRSDIYSLGVLLYELLTGKTPFDAKELLAAGLDEMRRTIREKEPVRPSTRLSTMLEGELTTTARHRGSDAPKLVNLLRGDLDWIVMKTLEKDRTRRYETANGLAMDVQRHLSNEPVVARPPSQLYRFQKLARRNRLALAAACAVFLALIGGLSLASLGWRQARVDRDKADASRQLAEKEKSKEIKARSEAEDSQRKATQLVEEQGRQIYALDMYRAFQYLQNANLGQVHELLKKHAPKNGGKDLRGFEWRYLWANSRGDQLATLANLSSGVAAVEASPGGRFLAYATTSAIIIRDSTGPRSVLKEIPFAGAETLSFSLGDRWLAGATGSSVSIWDTSSWEEIRTFQETAYPAKFSHDGKWLAFVAGNQLQLVSTVDWKPVHAMAAAPTFNNWWFTRDSIEFSRDGRYFIYPAEADYLSFLDLYNLRTVEKWANLIPKCIALSLSPDGRFLARGELAKVEIWDLAEGKRINTLTEHKVYVTKLEFTADGKHLVSTSGDRSINVWDATHSYQHVKTMIGHLHEIWTMAVTPDSRTVMTGTVDGTVRLWAIQNDTQSEEQQFQTHDTIGFTSDGTGLFTLNKQCELFLWNLENGSSTMLGRIADSYQRLAAERGFHFASSSAKGNRIAFGMNDGTVRIWDQEKHQLQEDLLVDPGAQIAVVEFHPSNNDVLATGTKNGSVKIWNIRTHELLQTLTGPRGSVISLCFSPSDKCVGIGRKSGFQVVRLGEKIELFSFTGAYYAARFSPDGEYLAAANEGGGIVLYESKTGKRIARLTGHFAAADSLSFSPDGKTLASASNDETVKLWHFQTRTEMITLKISGVGAKVMFSPNDQQSSLIIGQFAGSSASKAFQRVAVPSLKQIDADQR